MDDIGIPLDDFIRTLNRIADFVDTETKDHSRKTKHIAVKIATELGWSGSRLAYLGYGADIHDIGKIAISPVVFRQPSKLTRGQYEAVKKHPDFGYEMIHNRELPQIVCDCVLYHHEHYDGSGYHGIKGKDIPECAQIVCISDVWESITSDRPYRMAFSRENAISIMNDSKAWFGPKVYKAFLSLIERGEL